MPVLRLNGQAIDGGIYACTGPQLVAMLECLIDSGMLDDSVWYAGDVIPADGRLVACGTHAANLVGATDELIAAAAATPQFRSGVFLCWPEAWRPMVLADGIMTDGPMQKRLIGTLVEIVAFDTTCYDVISGDEALLATLYQRYGGEVYAEDRR